MTLHCVLVVYRESYLKACSQLKMPVRCLWNCMYTVHKGFKGTLVNRTIPSLNGSLAITLTVPLLRLVITFCNEHWRDINCSKAQKPVENKTIYVLNFSNEYDTQQLCSVNRHISQIVCFEAAGKTIRLITTSNRFQIG